MIINEQRGCDAGRRAHRVALVALVALEPRVARRARQPRRAQHARRAHVAVLALRALRAQLALRTSRSPTPHIILSLCTTNLYQAATGYGVTQV